MSIPYLADLIFALVRNTDISFVSKMLVAMLVEELSDDFHPKPGTKHLWAKGNQMSLIESGEKRQVFCENTLTT